MTIQFAGPENEDLGKFECEAVPRIGESVSDVANRRFGRRRVRDVNYCLNPSSVGLVAITVGERCDFENL